MTEDVQAPEAQQASAATYPAPKIIEAVGSAAGKGSASAEGDWAQLTGEAAHKALLLTNAVARQQHGLKRANQDRKDTAAAERTEWQLWAKELLAKDPRPSSSEIIGEIAKRARKTKRAIRRQIRLPRN
jgi:hypothetical protein